MSERNNNDFTSTEIIVADEIDCAFIADRLGDYTDGDLIQPVRQLVDQHIDTCVECASLLASYKHVIETAAELREPEEKLPVDVHNRLRAALNRRLGLSLPYTDQ